MNSDWVHASENIMQHSSYYHKRYEGYVEKLVADANGKWHIERVYTGDYYRQDMTAKKRFVTRIVYAGFYLLASAIFVLVSARSTQSNLAIPIQLVSFLSLAAMLMMLVYLITYIASPQRMTVWAHYAGPVRVKQWSRATAILLAMQALAVAVFILRHRDVELLGELINVGGYVAASLAMLSINRIESKITCKKTLSECEPPRGGYCVDS